MCGILGVFGSPKAAKLAALGLFAIQHRGRKAVAWRFQMAR
jgi:glutamine phosphoribosylpyrophosphate amidotransferase